MIKNLVTSGCSFTIGDESWPHVIGDQLGIARLFNLAAGGAGNRYICNSVIDTIQHHHLRPNETMVLVMWSGPARLDELVSGEYWYLLSDYHYKTKLDHSEDGYWIHSGGRGNSWQDHDETVRLFQQKYIVSDSLILCKETLVNILTLENFLQRHSIAYKFMSYVNYWPMHTESVVQGDYSLPYFCSHLPVYQQISFQNWIFVNKGKDCFYEFCRDNQYLQQDNFHPTRFGHKKFVENVLLPQLDLRRNQR